MTRRQTAAKGELSSTSPMLRNMRLPGGKYPGESVVKEARKGAGGVRYLVTYSGKVRKANRRMTAQMARDRGFDLSHQRYLAAPEHVKAEMLQKSLRWQASSKKRWIARMQEKIGTVTDPRKKARLQAQLRKFRRAPVNSPHTGKPPVSAYLRRYWE